MINHQNRSKKSPRYQALSSGYTTHGITGSPGDIGAGYRPHKLIGEYVTRAEAEAADYDAQPPTKPVIGTNSTWYTVEQAYVHDRLANR